MSARHTAVTEHTLKGKLSVYEKLNYNLKKLRDKPRAYWNYHHGIREEIFYKFKKKHIGPFLFGSIKA
jgi:hypothetical protein